VNLVKNEVTFDSSDDAAITAINSTLNHNKMVSLFYDCPIGYEVVEFYEDEELKGVKLTEEGLTNTTDSLGFVWQL